MSKLGKIYDKIEAIKIDLEQMAEEAQETFDNRSEKWQESEKGDEWQDKITAMEDAASNLQDAMDYIQDYV